MILRVLSVCPMNPRSTCDVTMESLTERWQVGSVVSVMQLVSNVTACIYGRQLFKCSFLRWYFDSRSSCPIMMESSLFHLALRVRSASIVFRTQWYSVYKLEDVPCGEKKKLKVEHKRKRVGSDCHDRLLEIEISRTKGWKEFVDIFSYC